MQKFNNFGKMIEKIFIHNFQSHRDTYIELDPSVNTLQGNSDCGKSAVMRALNWLLYNPAGDYFVSDWARKGRQQVEPCEVAVVVDGHTIVRRRDKDFNGYILDGETFEATRNSVPQRIQDILNMGDVNVQRQLDPPFLLSMSSGEVSRYVNNLVNLTRIDTWVSSANSRERKLRQDRDAEAARLEDAEAAVESFSYLPRLEELSEEVTSRCGRVAELMAELSTLRPSIAEYERRVDGIGSFPDSDIVDGALAVVARMLQDKTALEREVVVLGHELDEHAGKSGICADSTVDRLVEIVDRLATWNRVRGNMETACNELSNTLERHRSLCETACLAEHELPGIMRELDGMVCPLCGRRGIHEEA